MIRHILLGDLSYVPNGIFEIADPGQTVPVNGSGKGLKNISGIRHHPHSGDEIKIRLIDNGSPVTVGNLHIPLRGFAPCGIPRNGGGIA